MGTCPIPEHDLTLDKRWQQEQTDRLLGFEILWRTLTGRSGMEVDPERVDDLIAAPRSAARTIVQRLKRRFNAT
jgi:hypothetical protein